MKATFFQNKQIERYEYLHHDDDGYHVWINIFEKDGLTKEKKLTIKQYEFLKSQSVPNSKQNKDTPEKSKTKKINK